MRKRVFDCVSVYDGCVKENIISHFSLFSCGTVLSGFLFSVFMLCGLVLFVTYYDSTVFLFCRFLRSEYRFLFHFCHVLLSIEFITNTL